MYEKWNLLQKTLSLYDCTKPDKEKIAMGRGVGSRHRKWMTENHVVRMPSPKQPCCGLVNKPEETLGLGCLMWMESKMVTCMAGSLQNVNDGKYSHRV